MTLQVIYDIHRVIVSVWEESECKIIMRARRFLDAYDFFGEAKFYPPQNTSADNKMRAGTNFIHHKTTTSADNEMRAGTNFIRGEFLLPATRSFI